MLGILEAYTIKQEERKEKIRKKISEPEIYSRQESIPFRLQVLLRAAIILKRVL